MKVQYQPPFAEDILRSICSSYSHQGLKMFLGNSELDRALGCMFGSFSGDSIGSYLEFNQKFTQNEVIEAMEMTPGGTFNLRAGQVTDDSEMSFHLLQALSYYDPKRSMKEQRLDLSLRIASGYLQWKKSKPFDIGNTTRSSLKVLQSIQQVQKVKKSQKEYAFNDVLYKIAQKSHVSQSNGSLMKITPMIFFLTLLTLYPQRYDRASQQEEMLKLAEDQIRMVHPNQILIECSMLWIKTLFQLCIRKNNSQIKSIYQKAVKRARLKLGNWADQLDQLEPMPATANIGWAKIAWSYGMRELKEISNILEKNPQYKLDDYYYLRVIENVLKRGGDTDTNCAIVGGLIGALVGFKKLPEKYIKKMMEVNYKNQQLKRSHDRPSFYEPRTAMKLAFRCFQQLKQHSQNKNKAEHKPKV